MVHAESVLAQAETAVHVSRDKSKVVTLIFVFWVMYVRYYRSRGYWKDIFREMLGGKFGEQVGELVKKISSRFCVEIAVIDDVIFIFNVF